MLESGVSSVMATSFSSLSALFLCNIDETFDINFIIRPRKMMQAMNNSAPSNINVPGSPIKLIKNVLIWLPVSPP